MIRIISILSLICVSSGLKLKIGGLFDTDNPDLQESFRYAIELANKETLVNTSIRLVPNTFDIPYGNEFAASKNLCRLMKRGTPAVIGPSSPTSSSHCINICDAKEIPYIDVNFDPETKPPVINMHPHPDAIAQLFVDFINASEWRSFTVIYESAPWVPRVARLLELYDTKEYSLTARRINVEQDKMNFRHTLHRVKKSSDTNIVLDCSIETLPEVLKQAQQVGLMTDYHQFIVTSMDLQTIDLEPYQYSGTTVKGIRLVDPESPLMEHLTKFFAEEDEPQRGNEDEEPERDDADDESERDNVDGEIARNNAGEEESESTNDDEEQESVTVQSALIFDGVLLLAEAIKQFDTEQLKPKKMSCEDNEGWENGHSITNFMRNTIVHGLSGEVKFDHRGYRTDFVVDIMDLTSSGLAKVGTWNSTSGFNVTAQLPKKTNAVDDDGTLKNKTLIVITALTPPYAMLINSTDILYGNARFEGYGIDLIYELSLLLEFKYEFRLQEDKDYGVKNNVTEEWTGMIKELIEQRADLAIVDLTITAERESGVDFTMPFMNLGISVLFKEPTEQEPSTFSFMSPFAPEVWICLGAAYFGVSLCLFILGRISPSEWDNPYPCIEEPTELENQFSFSNALWFATGALLQQGSDIAPKAPSTRALATTWWFFTLIMVSSYTANLAAFLTIVGAKKSGSTINFFKDATHGTYVNMYKYMQSHPELLTDDNDEGLQRAIKTNYAYLMESSSIQYYVARNCGLKQLGDLLDEKGYGIAMRKNSKYRNELSTGVLQLQEQGTLAAMKNKWWNEKTKGTVCPKNKAGGDAQELDMPNMFGVFIVLLAGSIIASIYGIIEWLLIIRHRAKRENVPFKEELMDEIKFIVKCSGNAKTVKHRKSTSMESRRSYESDGSLNFIERQQSSTLRANVLTLENLQYLHTSSDIYYTIAGLFDTNVEASKEMFRCAVEVVNSEVLAETDIQLDPRMFELSYGNELAASKSVCKMLRVGIGAIFGPSTPSSSTHCMNICDTKDIPYIDVKFDYDTIPPAINMHPHPDAVAYIFVDLIKAWQWEGFTIIYESASWLPKVAELLNLYDPKAYTITVRRVNVGLDDGNYRPVLRRVKVSGDTNILLDCSIETLPELLKQAQQVGLMTDNHQFIITTMDMHTIDLEPYQYSGTNITGIRLVDPGSPVMEHLTKFFAKEGDEEGEEGNNDKEEPENEEEEQENDEEETENEEEQEPENDEEKTENDEEDPENEEDDSERDEEDEEKEETENADEEPESLISPESVTVQSALIYDGVLLLAEVFKQYDPEQLEPKQLNCMDNEAWENGNSITNFMRNTIVHGLSGEIKFDNRGYRTNVAVDIMELTSSGLSKVGIWNTTDGLTITRTYQQQAGAFVEGSLKNKTFIVLTALTAPYGMLKDSADKLTGNDRFEGFGIDVIHELSLMLGFNYEFRLQENGVYGDKNNVTKEWNGMIRELLDWNADLAITDLTITSERESGVDFTMPFMNLGISILFRKPKKDPPSTFSFMSPFSGEVWMYVGGAYLSVSFCLFILGRLSPSEWDNPYPCIEEPTELENQFTLRNSLWFTIGALLQQGSEIAPKAPSTRAVAAMWWFFTLIMVSSYTANLAAFLTVQPSSSPLESAEDLKNCHNPAFECPVQFGSKRTGSTYNFFKEAEHETYRNMFSYMTNHPELLTADNNEGLKWAQTKNYAFLMESSSIEYLVERNCDVTQVGGLLDDKGYGIAMRKNSSYRNDLSEGVLRLQEQGKLTTLKIKWWKEKKGGGACADAAGDGEATPLEIANVEGVFLLLILGIGVAVLFNLLEVLFAVFTRSRHNKVPFMEELIAELKFIIKLSGNTKTVRRRKSTPSMGSRRSNES